MGVGQIFEDIMKMNKALKNAETGQFQTLSVLIVTRGKVTIHITALIVANMLASKSISQKEIDNNTEWRAIELSIFCIFILEIAQKACTPSTYVDFFYSIYRNCLFEFYKENYYGNV